jgi:hypothetical protein
VLVIALLIGCGGSDPNQTVANDLIQRGVITDLCHHVQIHGRGDAVQWLTRNVPLHDPKWPVQHEFSEGATPEGVTAELLPHCLPDGTWTLDEH